MSGVSAGADRGEPREFPRVPSFLFDAGDAPDHPERVLDGTTTYHIDSWSTVGVGSQDVIRSFEVDAGSKVWSVLGALGRRLCFELLVAELHRSLRDAPPVTTRVRELFPLPLLDRGERDLINGVAESAEQDFLDYLDAVIVGLNWMYGIRSSSVVCGRHTAAQRTAQEVIVQNDSATPGERSERLGRPPGCGVCALLLS